MTFNLHGNKTADGVVITRGLAVLTNEYVVGVVLSDADEYHTKCCGYEAHNNGQLTNELGTFTDHSAMLILPDCQRCKHNHWFYVQYEDGSAKTFDGERMATRDPQTRRLVEAEWAS